MAEAVTGKTTAEIDFTAPKTPETVVKTPLTVLEKQYRESKDHIKGLSNGVQISKAMKENGTIDPSNPLAETDEYAKITQDIASGKPVNEIFDSYYTNLDESTDAFYNTETKFRTANIEHLTQEIQNAQSGTPSEEQQKKQQELNYNIARLDHIKRQQERKRMKDENNNKNSLNVLLSVAQKYNIDISKLPNFDPQNGQKLETQEQKIAIKLKQQNLYLGKNGETYQVLTPAESYQKAVEGRKEQPDQTVLDRLSQNKAPDIYNNMAIVVSGEKYYRPRLRNGTNPDKVLTSYLVANMVGSNNTEIVSNQIIEGKSVLLEEYKFGARQMEASDINLMTQDEINKVIAHALITEDLDWQGRNFIVTKEGKIVRCDSKQVFQDETDQLPDAQFLLQDKKQRQQVIEDKIKSNSVMQELLTHVDPAAVETIISNFDPELIRKNLIKQGIDSQTIDNLISKIKENSDIDFVKQRLLNYRKIANETF